MAFEHEMINLSKRWKELGLADACPYPLPTSAELLEHQKEYEKFCFSMDLKRRLVELLETTSEGWVPIDLWEATEKTHQEAFSEIVQTVGNAKGEDDMMINEEDMRRIWPFDIK